jgi:hypothetical protein
LVVARIRDVGDMRDHHELMKPRAERPQRVDESLMSVLILAAEDLVERDEAEFRVALAGDPVGDSEAQAEVGEILPRE